jgi:type IV secretory pathway VirB10-like protein
MAKHAGPPESGADNSADHPADHPPGDSGQDFSQDIDQDVDPAAASPPARFGRLALWVASASALTLGVLATVAYGVWFDQDQRAYAKAMTVAQQTLSTGVAVVPAQQALPTATPPVPAQQAAWSGHVAPASPPPAPSTTLADATDADLTPLTSHAQRESTAVTPPASLAPHSSAGQSAAVSCSMKQARHRPAPRVKPNNGLFARMESFFHRVSYRQHGNGSQRDLYAHS